MQKFLIFLAILIISSRAIAQTGITVAGGNGCCSCFENMFRPNDVFVDTGGYIFVSDDDCNRILRFPPNSTADSFGVLVTGGNINPGTGPGEFQRTEGIFLDSAGNLFVADFYNNRIQKFARDSSIGVTVAGDTIAGSGANQLNLPWAVYVDHSGNMYVADHGNFRVQKFPAGSPNAITLKGPSDPYGIFGDKNDYIYVADLAYSGIRKFPAGSDSTTAGVIVAGGNSIGDSNQLVPSDVFLDTAGNIFVVDANNVVQKFPPNSNSATKGITVAGGNGMGSAENQLNRPSGLCLDTKGNIYIADRDNFRIQKWAQNPLGISNNGLVEANVRVYPNPNNGSFMLQSDYAIGGSYVVYNIMGSIVARNFITSAKQPVELKGLASGSYLILVQINGGRKAIKFEIEK